MNDKYFDPRFGGVDWAAVRTQYEPQVAARTTDQEFLDLLRRMLREIKISHLNIVDLATLDKAFARAVVTRGLALRDIDNQVVVTRIIDGSPAAAAGLRTGFIVRAIDDAPVVTARAAENKLAQDTEKHRLAIVDETAARREIEMAYALPPADKLESVRIISVTRRVLVETKMLGDGIGYIYFTNFIAPMKKRLLAVFDSMRDATAIIIDLRGNTGGETETGLALAGMLLDRETQFVITQTRKGDDHRYKVKPQKNPYRRPVVLLLDEECASESEELAAGLQAASRVVVVGRKSRGEDMDSTVQPLPMNALGLQYPVGLPRTPNGVVIEGRGVTPDIEVSLTRPDLLNGRDSQLEAAIARIRGRKQ